MEQMLTEDQLRELRNKYLGQRVSVPMENKLGFDYGDVVGECNYIGYNPFFPDHGLQVTVNRLPIRNVDHTQIKKAKDISI